MATITKRGEYQFQVQVRTKGFPPQTKTFETRKEAKAWASVIESEQARGVFHDRRVIENTSLFVALERYLQEVTPRKRAKLSESGLIRRWQRHPLALRSLASLQGVDFSTYRDQRLETVGANTVRLELALISHLFTVATQDWSMPLNNPIKGIRKPKLPPARDRRLEGDEEDRLLKAAETSEAAPWLAACIQLALETMMRGGEILSIEWSQVNLKRGIIKLDMTKNGDARVVPLNENAVDILQSLPRKISGPVIGAFYDICGLDRAFAIACRKAGITGLHFHDLRHESASRAAPFVPAQTLAKIGGWKTLQMVMRYYNPNPDELVSAVRRIGAR